MQLAVPHYTHADQPTHIMTNRQLPISEYQKRFFLEWVMAPKESTYNVSLAYKIYGNLNKIALKGACELAVKRHEVAHARYNQDGSKCYYADYAIADFFHENVLDENKNIKLQIREILDLPFDLTQDVLLRFYLLSDPNNCNEYYFIVSAHHVINDAQSATLVADEITVDYNRLSSIEQCTNTIVNAQSKITTFTQAVLSEQQILTANYNEQARDFWLDFISYLPLTVQLPYKSGINLNKKDSEFGEKTGEFIYFELDAQQTLGLNQYARKNKATLFIIISAIYGVILSKYANQEKFFISYPINMRSKGCSYVAGSFVNNVPLKIELDKHFTFTDLISDLIAQRKNVRPYQGYSLTHIVNDQRIYKQTKLDNYFNVDIIHTNLNLLPLDLNGLDTKVFDIDWGTNAIRDFGLYYDDGAKNKIKFKLEYKRALLDKELVDSFVQSFKQLIARVINLNSKTDAEEIILKNYCVLDKETRTKVITTWNQTEAIHPEAKTLQELFEKQVQSTPDSIAVVCEGRTLTYLELNQRANQLASLLKKTYTPHGDDLIALYLDPSEHMLIAVLAALKSGAGYVPIDPDQPDERIAYILEDTKAKVVLTNSRHVENLRKIILKNLSPVESSNVLKLLSIDDLHLQAELTKQNVANPLTTITSSHLAYVIYTSGSTGKPKGVMVEHRSVVDFLMGIKPLISSNGTWLAITNISFDISILELIGSLLSGFKLIIMPNNEFNASACLSNQNKGMDFGLFYFGNYDSSQQKNENPYNLLMEGAKFADMNEFSSIWTPERHFSVFGGLYPNPSVTSAALAVTTKNIHIRTGSLVLPLHNPIRVAEDWALIDNLSHGRVGLSLATGWHQKDFTLAPENFIERKNVLVENLAILKKLWRGESVKFNGVDGKTTYISTFPRPIQSELPIWFTAAGNPESFRQAGTLGANLLTHLLGQSIEELADKIKIYKDALTAANFQVNDKTITLMLHTFVSHSEEFSLQQVKEPFKNYLKTSVDLMKQFYNGDEDINKLDAETLDAILEQAFERYYYTSGLFGTPTSCQTIIDKLKGIGVTEIACLIDFGIADAIVLENLNYLNDLRLSVKPVLTPENSNNIVDIIKKHKVTHLQCTPSFAQLIFEQNNKQKLESLTTIMIGGEPMSLPLLERIRQNTTATVRNMYGPTETTIWSTSSLIAHDGITIGMPLANENAYILDNNLVPLPIGAIGELYIGGTGLARGYLNQPELTTERFIVNPFQSETEKAQGNNTKLYKTGDLVRYLSDGNIEYIGRNDFQVKIRGHRIELGEIENALIRIKGIKQSCVLAKDRITENGASKYLVGYYVLDNESVVDNNADIITNWENLYDIAYTQPSANTNDIEADFSGWNSFITSKPIPINEMQVWRDVTVENVKALQPRIILEIGVGSGLLMYPLLDSVDKYVGLDISNEIIQRHKDYLQHKSNKVKLYQLAADRIDEVCPEQFFDCIIINSVCQYFPSIKYFENVIAKAITKLKLGGSLFIGDVRNYNFHQNLIQDKFLFEHRSFTTDDINQLLDKEGELLISPEYFLTLNQKFNNINISILEKHGEYNNELKKYRYDVIVTIKQPIIIQDRNNQLSTTYKPHHNIPFLNKLSKAQIQLLLSQQLPEYMVPDRLIEVKSLPLTINGKLDRNALSDLEFNQKEKYVAPRTEFESKICAIYAGVLGLNSADVGIRDDIFNLGVDSIISIQLVSRLRQKLELNVSVKDIFNSKNIEKLYDHVISTQLINQSKSLKVLIQESGILRGKVPLLPIQEYFLINVANGNYARSGHWNQSFLIKVKQLDQELLAYSIDKLIEYHDAFRLEYKQEVKENLYTQFYSNRKNEPTPCSSTDDGKTKPKTQLHYLDLSSLPAETSYQDILTRWQSEFELTNSTPLYSIGYIEGFADGSSRIFFALHHLLVDAVSWRIIVHDLKELYHQFEQAKKLNKLEEMVGQDSAILLGRKGTSYRQWVSLMKRYAEQHEAEKVYWQTQLSELNEAQSKLKSLVLSDASRNHALFKLDQETTRLLLTKSNQAHHTEINDLLLSSFGLVLAKLTNSNISYITLEGHGREELTIQNSETDLSPQFVDITRTVGWFTSMYPVKLEVDSHSLSNTIIQIKEDLRKIPNKGIGYGAIYGYTKLLLPRVSFNYLGQFDQSLAAGHVDNNYWNITGEPSGVSISAENQDINIINVNGAVVNGELNFRIASQLSQSDLDKFCQNFKTQLEAIVEYTTTLDRSYLTVSDVDKIINQNYLDRLQANKEITKIYLANSLQQGFIYHVLNQEVEATPNNIQMIYSYNNSLEPELLKTVWQAAVNRYPSLRLRFAWEDELVQIVDKEQTLEWYYSDLCSKNNKDQARIIEELIQTDRQRGYVLTQGNLLRIYLIKQAEERYLCILGSHHGILDGWSNPVLFGFVHTLYQKLIQSGNKAKSTQIIQTIHEEESYLYSQKYLQENTQVTKEYWQTEIARIKDYADLSGLLRLDKREVKLNEYRIIHNYAQQNKIITGTGYKRLKDFSQLQKVTINAILQYAWHKLLSIYGNTLTTVVGTTVSGRNLPIDNIEESVGLYINTLPFIVEHQADEIIVDSLRKIQDKLNDINTYSNMSLAKLQHGSQRLFDTLFVYENYPVPPQVQNNPIKFRFERSIEGLDYPLEMVVYEQEYEIRISLKYVEELFVEETITDVLNTFTTLIQQIINISDLTINKELSYLDQEAYTKVTTTWNDTLHDYPSSKTIHQLFEEQVERTPQAIAVSAEDGKLTYQELNIKANQLAHYLIQLGITPEASITVCLYHSLELAIAFLAILKAGGKYVPVDPNYPTERLVYLLTDSATKVILTEEAVCDHLPKASIKTLYLNQINVELKKTSKHNPSLVIQPENLACVIYTSGSTGKPKGVMLTHANICNHTYWMQESFRPTVHDKILHQASISFDMSLSVLSWLLMGAQVVMAQKSAQQDPKWLIETIQSHSVTTLEMVPALLQALLDYPEFAGCKSLKQVNVGGDILSKQLQQQFFKMFNYIPLYNCYGPTETTIDATYFICQKNNVLPSIIIIGKPIFNLSCYILSNEQKPLPIGATGELYIGGIGLARGYLNLPELTREKFIANPFQSEAEKLQGKNARLYKTGDLARYMWDGNIEYIGRNDFQVKIRGYRIETGEIESKLAIYPGIKQAIVVAFENKNIQCNTTYNKYLVGYYVADKALDEEAILTELAQQLPEYMLPNKLIYMEQLPLISSGKLDRNALPDPEFINRDIFVSPRNELESNICAIYAETLGLDVVNVGIKDDFFRLGGNSILAIKLITKLNAYYHSQLKVAEIFYAKCVENLAKLISHKKDKYQMLLRLNNASDNKPIMFMVHPGFSGCEVYVDLANKLTNYYLCYGVDNYNLHSTNKILTLNKLSNHYLENILTQFDFKNTNTEIVLLGWSLGGLIALEIASILEKHGHTNIKVCLLDTFIWDEKLKKIDNDYDEQLKKNLPNHLSGMYENCHVQKILANHDVESNIVKETITDKLKHTKIILYKAMKKDTRIKIEANDLSYKHTKILKYNNVDTIVCDSAQLKLITVENAHHGNIIEKVESYHNIITGPAELRSKCIA
jgi:natural product biosynthesis luciferase-like monooxygenase protein/amino acid adenylation domain-containing protein/non-ribosomal peptide synthase protein (TIGR01720 family)